MSTPPSPTESPSPSGPQSLEPTGVPQLDLALGGGLPRGALVILLGPPGSGKTTLASQMAFAAARRGQHVLFLTAFSEPTTKLFEHLRSYHFFDRDVIGETMQVFSLQQFLSQGTLQTSEGILSAARQVQAKLVILDGFQALRELGPEAGTPRHLLYDLGTHLSLLGATTLMTTEATPRDPASFPEMTTADALIGLYYDLQGVRVFRGLEVLKVRGQAPLPGRHSLTLSEEGMRIFPRLETRVSRSFSAGWSPSPRVGRPEARATFGLPELDGLLGGGLPRQTSTLLTGSLGTGKTLLGLQFALEGVSRGEPALFLGFRETAEQLLQKARAFGLDEQLHAAMSVNRHLLFQRWEPVETDPDRVANDLLRALEGTGVRRVVIDSIAELERAVEESSGGARVPNYLAALLAVLRARGVTLLAIKEASKAVAAQLDFSVDDLSVLAENVLLLQQLAYRGRLHRVLSVIKMRFSSHDYTLREFLITSPQGIRVLTREESGRDLLIGLTGQPTGAEPIGLPESPLSPQQEGKE